MSAPHFHWFLPTTDDGPYLAPADDRYRRPTIGYLTDVARAAERNGLESLLVPTGSHCEDAWVVASAVSQHTERIKFLVAFRPGMTHPTLSAQVVQTFQRLTGNRLNLNVVTGGDPREQRAFGDHLDKDARYRRTDEFLEVVRGCWGGAPYCFHGEYYDVEHGGLVEPLKSDDQPLLFFGGASSAAQLVSARHADVQLMFGEPPPMASERIARLRALAAEQGRTISFGIRIHVINRDTSDAAWREANRLLDILPDELINKRQAGMAASEAEGQRRISSLHNGTKHDRKALEVYPNVWAGTGLVLGGGGTALVGSHEEVADRIREYQAAGMDHFVLSGYPKLEGAYWFGEGVVPLFDRQPPSQREATRSVMSPV
jgi:alkanesulfonate monooxygenase